MPHEPVAYERVPKPESPYGYGYRYLSLEQMVKEVLTLEGRRGKLHKIGGVGTGAMLIRKSLLLRMAEANRQPKQPPHNRRAEDQWERPIFQAPPIAAGRQWTEDLWFCEMAHRLDPPANVWLDSAGSIAHQGDQIWIRDQHYLGARGLLGMTAEAAANAAKKPEPVWSGKIILPS